MSAPNIYGRWRGFLNIVDALLGNPDGTQKLDAAFASAAAPADGIVVGARTALLDFKTAADNLPFNVPLTRSGYWFIPTSYSILFKQRVGTATGNLVISVGNNAARTNVVPTGSGTIIAAVINITAAPAYGSLGAPNVSGFDLVDSATEAKAKIVTGITGITTATGRITVSGLWVPV